MDLLTLYDGNKKVFETYDYSYTSDSKKIELHNIKEWKTSLDPSFGMDKELKLVIDSDDSTWEVDVLIESIELNNTLWEVTIILTGIAQRYFKSASIPMVPHTRPFIITGPDLAEKMEYMKMQLQRALNIRRPMLDVTSKDDIRKKFLNYARYFSSEDRTEEGATIAIDEAIKNSEGGFKII